ncbi:MltR family transcriptional regulator [Bacillus cereus group sp. N3]|uniref:MltR family transcriptional regulator n=1 Tax=Bacillus cereus group sp. N3 TaxID=2794582 RepID=UPI0018F740FC|nr:MltR family transcriptional regulator [Bacillus cereus group sp. N3]MBJ8128922.1 transcriptional regulator [Bacillus cereus group sp. N3]
MENQPMHEMLKRLTENNQYIKAIGEFEKELKNSSDRGLVLVCGSIIDQVLSNLLKAFLIKSDNVEKDLFKGNGILSTFDSKIQMSYYLGLISKNEKLNITYIQRIRNKFAHQFIDISFESNDIINVCRNFEIPKNCFVPKNIPLTKEGNGELPQVELNPIKKGTSAKERFIFTFRYLYHSLIHKIISDEFERREETKVVITADDAILRQIRIIESTLDKYEKVISEMQDRLDKKKSMQGTIYTKDDIGEYEVKVEQTKKEYEQLSQVFNSTVIPPLRYTYDVMKNSMK